jgi:hypothetical protein
MLNIHVEKLAWHVNNLDFEKKFKIVIFCDFFYAGCEHIKQQFCMFSI